MATELRHRAPAQTTADIPAEAAPDIPAPEILTGAKASQPDVGTHPSGKEKHGWLVQILRGLSAMAFLITCSIA